ncbi:MAG: phosphoglucosamine mutase [Opitutia bacterium Tous-C1TDCM]|nr:MAG: phosphoglucosamine mutase [Opitutae bacterium Tous-C1TDCM]
MSRLYFGTDGVRGPYGGPLLNETFVARLAQAAATWRLGQRRGSAGTVLIGRDTRASGEALEAAVARGLRAAGAEPVSLGVVPTPAVARAVRRTQADLGVVITASHNPAADNGIKFFGPAGMKLTDAEEAAIEALLPAVAAAGGAAPSVRAGARDEYIAAALALLPGTPLAGWALVLDTANGATAGTSPEVFRRLGATVAAIGDRPDGQNINDGVGSEHPEALAARVRAVGARLGVAHDGDGDRCVLCDETGVVLDGDELMTILATHALARGTLTGGVLVTTKQSNLGVDAAVASAGGRVVRTDIGDRYVMERMVAEGATLGGESSGHIICSDVSPTGDGLVAALRVVGVMLETGRPLSELRRCLRRFPQRTSALKVREKRPLAELPTLPGVIAALEAELGAAGRVLVRYSGTEAKLRLLIEGPAETVVDAGLARLAAAVRADLDVV